MTPAQKDAIGRVIYRETAHVERCLHRRRLPPADVEDIAQTAALVAFRCIAKGSLVALFFMHLYDQQGANRLVFVTSLVFVSLLIGLTVLDNATRFPLANPPGSRGALPVGGASRDPTDR